MTNQKVSEIKIEEIRVLRCTFEFLDNHICLDFGGKTVNDLDMDLIKTELVRQTARVIFDDDIVAFEYDDWETTYEIMRFSRSHSEKLFALKHERQQVSHKAFTSTCKVFIASLVNALFQDFKLVRGLKTTGLTCALYKQERKEQENGII